MTNTVLSLHDRFLAAQKEMVNPSVDMENAHFNSRYVSLNKILETIRIPLNKHGLTIVQDVVEPATGKYAVYTAISDGMNEPMSCTMPIMCAKMDNPQAWGSSVTYARKQGLMALCCLASAADDDDGNSGADNPPPKAAAKPKDAAAAPYESAAEAISAISSCETSYQLSYAVMPRLMATKKVGRFTDAEHEEARRVIDAVRAKLTQAKE